MKFQGLEITVKIMECGYSEPKKKERKKFLRGAVAAATLCCKDVTFRGPWIVIYSYNKTNEMHCLLASSEHNLYDIYLLQCVQCYTLVQNM